MVCFFRNRKKKKGTGEKRAKIKTVKQKEIKMED